VGVSDAEVFERIAATDAIWKGEVGCLFDEIRRCARFDRVGEGPAIFSGLAPWWS